MQEVEVRPREAAAAAAAATISLTAPAAPRGSRGSSGDSSELEPTASGSVTSGGSSGADESPMDLSSGGTTAAVSAAPAGMAMPITPTTLMHNAALVRLDEDHPLLNARKLNARMLAEFVKAQHLAQQQKANETTPPSAAAAAAAEVAASRMHHPKKRPYTPLPEDAFVDARSGLIPLDLLRAKLELQQERRSPDGGETERNSSNSSTPSLASANNVVSNGNNNATSSGREVKKRRLDALLNKKFAVADSPPSELESSPSPRPMMHNAVSPPLPLVPAALPPTHHLGNSGGGGGSRRKSSEHQPRKANRRKQPHPQSPPTLSVRPTAELFPQRPLSPSKVSATMMSSPLRPLAIPSPTERKATTRQVENGVEAEALKGQILQLQLMQAALLSASAANPAASDLLKTALGGAATGQQQSLLHYGYFAQMLQNLQSQQTKLVEQLVAGKAGVGGAPKAELDPPQLPGRFKFPPTTESILREPPRNHQGLPPPFDLTAAFSPRKTVNGSIFRGSPIGSPSPLSPALPMGILPSPAGAAGAAAGAAGDAGGSPSEPRRRAPRALTGRYVRSGTGASPATLEILRKKILDRMRLKELLGENSHLYFGALNKQGKNAKNGGFFQRKK